MSRPTTCIYISDPADRSCDPYSVNDVRGQAKNALGIGRNETQEETFEERVTRASGVFQDMFSNPDTLLRGLRCVVATAELSGICCCR